MKKIILLISIIYLLPQFVIAGGATPPPCVAPTNDLCAGATVIAIGGCTGAGVAGCNVTGDPGGTSCGPPGTGSAWYSFVAPASGNIDIGITLTGGYYGAIVLYSGTCGAQAEVGCYYPAPLANPYTGSFTGLTPGATYYFIMNSPDAYGGGDGGQTSYSDICVTDAGAGGCPNCTNGVQDCAETGVDCGGPDCAPCGATSCTDNEDCLAAAPIVLTAPGGADVCVTDCNTGASVGPDFTGNNCYDLPNETVWYSITTDAATVSIDVTLTSGDLSDPEFTVFTNVCGPYTIIECVEGTGGSASSLLIPVAVSTTYLIAVSDATGDVGDFTLCVSQDPDNSACNTTNSLTVTSTSLGSPLGGPYQMGEDVSFCYSLTDWQQINCNYIGAFVPEFGDCWDPASFDANGQPVNITTALNVNGVIQATNGPPGPQNPCAGTAAGSWQWFPAGTVTYNVNGYYPAGTAMPAGWYFLSSYDPVTGQCNGNDPTDPDFSFGDGNYPACGVNTFDYTVCFTLTTGTNPAQFNCVVNMKTFADGEFGAWANVGCTVDAQGNQPGVLPVELTNFTAEYIKGFVDIKWVTASEINNDYFTVEKTVDGKVFEVVGVVNGAGNSNTVLNYGLEDERPTSGTSYYRLKQTDFDGKFDYSDLVAVDVKSNIDGLYIYPNPVTNNGLLNFSADRDGQFEVTIYDVTGRKVLFENYTVKEGENNIELPTSSLKQGMYFVYLGNENEQTNIKFIKE